MHTISSILQGSKVRPGQPLALLEPEPTQIFALLLPEPTNQNQLDLFGIFRKPILPIF